jgi:hypothetical protein
VSSQRGIGYRIARIERAIVGAFMSLIALVAERRVSRELEGKKPKRSKRGLHVDVRDIKR